jgi:hypothetical protein
MTNNKIYYINIKYIEYINIKYIMFDGIYNIYNTFTGITR